jgi:hypothetical protein
MLIVFFIFADTTLFAHHAAMASRLRMSASSATRATSEPTVSAQSRNGAPRVERGRQWRHQRVIGSCPPLEPRELTAPITSNGMLLMHDLTD